MGKAVQINIVGKQGTPAKITNRRALLVDMQNESGQSILEVLAPKNLTPNLMRVTNAGTINVPVYDISVFNAGTDDGEFLGVVIKPGETVPYSAGALNNIYPANTFTYDATGTEFLIKYNS